MKTFLVDNGCQIYVNYFDILKVKNTKLITLNQASQNKYYRYTHRKLP